MDLNLSAAAPTAAPNAPAAPIDRLPTELLDAVLSPFPTRTVVALARVSRRFHSVAARLLYRRLRRAVAHPRYELILECYHPSAKISTPYLHCAYVGTDGLDHAVEDDDDTPAATLARLPSMYSRFRPLPPDDADVHIRNYRAIRRTMNFFLRSDVSSGTAGTAVPRASASTSGRERRPEAAEGSGDSSDDADSDDADEPLVSYDVHLDESELFSQLCVVTNLVKTGPRRGLFLSCVNINDGVIRVWRDWLADQHDQRVARGRRGKAVRRAAGEAGGVGGRADRPAALSAARPLARSLAGPPAQTAAHHTDTVLWAYTGKHVGLRFGVTDTTAEHARPVPVLALACDELPVSYQLEYEELLVRTHVFLEALEEAEVQEVSHSGRAMVLAAVL